jgi:hypothetical protein
MSEEVVEKGDIPSEWKIPFRVRIFQILISIKLHVWIFCVFADNDRIVGQCNG